VKALAFHFGLSDILEKVEKRGRWTVAELEKAVSRISEKLGKWFRSSWDAANYLHVCGFHEAKLDAESVKERVSDAEKMVSEAEKVVHGK